MEKINFEIIKQKLEENNCQRLIFSSAAEYLNEVLDNLSQIKPLEDVIEIGTHNGLSTSIISGYAKRIFTFDIALRNPEFIWNILDCRNKISSFVGSIDQIEYEINYIRRFWPNWTDINFNFAFIDGLHEYFAIEHDFNMVKFCGRVLFHDYNCCWGVRDFCNDIGIKSMGKDNIFAYWEG